MRTYWRRVSARDLRGGSTDSACISGSGRRPRRTAESAERVGESLELGKTRLIIWLRFTYRRHIVYKPYNEWRILSDSHSYLLYSLIVSVLSQLLVFALIVAIEMIRVEASHFQVQDFIPKAVYGVALQVMVMSSWMDTVENIRCLNVVSDKIINVI